MCSYLYLTRTGPDILNTIDINLIFQEAKSFTSVIDLIFSTYSSYKLCLYLMVLYKTT